MQVWRIWVVFAVGSVLTLYHGDSVAGSVILLVPFVEGHPMGARSFEFLQRCNRHPGHPGWTSSIDLTHFSHISHTS